MWPIQTYIKILYIIGNKKFNVADCQSIKQQNRDIFVIFLSFFCNMNGFKNESQLLFPASQQAAHCRKLYNVCAVQSTFFSECWCCVWKRVEKNYERMLSFYEKWNV